MQQEEGGQAEGWSFCSFPQEAEISLIRAAPVLGAVGIGQI